ncbi:MAG: hypothetical protein IJ682_07255, partial [Lachnospiraceae bacterium]|nr:hypothetical protein [Lachnospiraceae bacterium]
MGTVIDEHSLKIYQKINQGDLTAMRNRTTLLRAEQSRAEQRDNCALFASCGCGALETEYYIRDGKPSDLMGLLCPVRFGG